MLRTTFKFQLRNSFIFFGNMPSTLVKLCLKPHKIPKNFSSDEKEDNTMLLDVRKTKKRKKTQIVKYNFYNFILTLYGPTTENSSPCCCTSQQYLFISSGCCCCCFKLSSKQPLPFCHVFRVTNTKAPPIYFSLFTTSKGIGRANLSATRIISLAI